MVLNERIINAFMECNTITEISKRAGISRSTVYKLKDDPKLKKELSRRRSEIISGATNRIGVTLFKDVDALNNIINDPEVSPQVKINAIQLKFNAFRSWIELIDIDRRITELEEITAKQDTYMDI